MNLIAQIAKVFRRNPIKPANNVLHLDCVRAAHFFNCSARATRAQCLRGRYLDRCINHAKVVWQKHRDRVPGYELAADAEKAMLAYIDLQATYQRNDNKPAPDRPWSPRAA
jgi:hypothetical protein